MMLAPVLTPHGSLILRQAEEALAAPSNPRLEQAFSRGSGHGLLHLGADEVGTALPPVLSYWREFAVHYVTALCALPDIAEGGTKPPVPVPTDGELDKIAAAVPPMTGAEYLTAVVLTELWQGMDAAFDAELAAARLSVQAFLKGRHPAWNLVGRVHFNLAENRKDEVTPFAFLATYTTRLSAQAKALHVPLGRALQEYAGAKNRERLLSLLLPVQRAAEHCTWLKAMVDAGEIFHPLRWSPQQALQFLNDVPALEAAGIAARMPANWPLNRPARPKVQATVGRNAPSQLGMDALLDFRLDVTLDGEKLSAAEIKRLLAHSDGLALIRGKWVQVDHERLRRTLDKFEAIEHRAASDGLSFGEAMRMLAGAGIADSPSGQQADIDWSQTVAGPWLAETLAALRRPDGLARIDPGRFLQGKLRPYQLAGVQWLYLLTQLRLGACLADDMGLGKTIQVLSLLLVLKHEAAYERKPCLLVAPASLLANWASEIARFAPSLKTAVAHPSAAPAEMLGADEDNLAGVDLVITSYGFLARSPWLDTASWRLVVLDEAQAIKNPAAKQTKTVKRLRADTRIALTGTPIENRLNDLWSIFDFINPGLLGSPKQFSSFVKGLADRPHSPYEPLRDLVRPYILRRLKTDRSIIADLPDKTEMKAFCSLSRKQAALYQQAVEELARQLEDVDGMQRKGLVLAYLMRLKQICNHPSQWLGDGAWAEEDSGKLARLRDILEVIAARQEKALIFTQFRETTAPLAAFAGSLFGQAGLVLHGETEIKKRKDLVRRFQEDESIPFFVLSLKAGGAGLNLTAASHVVHFDRWWNPAVENQATDRAFRIGQNKNVLVHKFICRGTVEDRIDQLIESKRQLAGDLLGGGSEMMLTEMKDEDLLKLVALDLSAATKEG
ncbi:MULTISPECIES: DEAD/DEAH box helicase [Bradyrhizobium]|uniref:Non-specific serine/threonine protein kinase n=2 Tax=Bradyrhizobium TaxID=374 RepID=A0ABY0PPI0_9BRAD|nr:MULTISPECIES: DEAD/DEAH box helicase [Bradyrhizobium]SDI73013.1 non-specific serine/threonine protein kinase [Bradyrhizobium ottawaense]SED25080.1 non-specific serine/threonine protein kinase [Bradyrhizobium lablabi]